MNEREKLLIARHQIENITKLIKDNPYEKYMNNNLISVYYELQRQISLCD
tara:strand:+ start:931 stop:1080 length:150 start_codon:yes stop_codon:yes gene_type:complete